MLHPDAYKILVYEDEKTGELESIWNSRDGVTPFTIPSRTGGGISDHRYSAGLEHAYPLFVPPLGMRVFVAMSESRAMYIAAKQVSERWDSGMSDSFSSRDQAIKVLTASIYQDGEAPDLVEVTPRLRNLFQQILRRRYKERDMYRGAAQ